MLQIPVPRPNPRGRALQADGAAHMWRIPDQALVTHGVLAAHLPWRAPPFDCEKKARRPQTAHARASQPQHGATRPVPRAKAPPSCEPQVDSRGSAFSFYAQSALFIASNMYCSIC